MQKKIKEIQKRIEYTVHNEAGASTLEIVVIISIAMVLCTSLYYFRDNIMKFMNGSEKKASHIGWEQ